MAAFNKHSQTVPPAGKTHPFCFVIWGFNIAVIIGLLDLVTAPALPRRTAAVVIMFLSLVYAALVGAGASAIWAAMGVTYPINVCLLGLPGDYKMP